MLKKELHTVDIESALHDDIQDGEYPMSMLGKDIHKRFFFHIMSQHTRIRDISIVFLVATFLTCVLYIANPTNQKVLNAGVLVYSVSFIGSIAMWAIVHFGRFSPSLLANPDDAIFFLKLGNRELTWDQIAKIMNQYFYDQGIWHSNTYFYDGEDVHKCYMKIPNLCSDPAVRQFIGMARESQNVQFNERYHES